jgi:hypothetical protein
MLQLTGASLDLGLSLVATMGGLMETYRNTPPRKRLVFGVALYVMVLFGAEVAVGPFIYNQRSNDRFGFALVGEYFLSPRLEESMKDKQRRQEERRSKTL